MAIKKGIINVSGTEIEQYVIEDEKDVESFFRKFPKMTLTSLKSTFKDIVRGGAVIITDTDTNMAGFYSWRTAGEENWNIVKML